MIILTLLMLFVIGGFAGRVRGQAEPWGDTVSRYLVWGGPVGMLVLAAYHNPLYCLAAMLLAGAGASLGYHAECDLSVPANRNIKNYTVLTLVGMFRFAPMFAGACFLGLQGHVLPAVLAGVSFVPAYLAGLQVIKFAKWSPLFDQFTCWGEFIFWGTIFTVFGAGLFI